MLVLAVVAPRSHAATSVSGTLTADTTWTLAGSPYNVTANVTVASGVTLTVEPSVQVLFNNGTLLRINGTIRADGTAASPISFNGVTPTPGFWDGIAVHGTALIPNTGSTFRYVTVANGGGTCSFCAGLYVEYGSVTVSNSSFNSSLTDGIWVYAGNADVSASSFTGNTRAAIRYQDAASNPVLSSLTATGNGINAVALGAGTLVGAHTWEATGIPYVVTSFLTVAAGASLTIAPGQQILFDAGMGLTARGSLTAVGTAASPIVMTGSSPGVGFWDGVQIIGTAPAQNISSIAHVLISGGGGSTCSFCANLYIEEGQVAVSNSRFENSGKDGLWVWSGNANITDSTFLNNTLYPIRYQTAAANPVFSGLVATGNGTNAIALGVGTLQGNHVWENVGLPYEILGTVTVDTGDSLTIPPGLQVRFAQNTGLISNGTLIANGTAAAPILLTGTAASAGWWRGVEIKSSGTAPNVGSSVSYATISGGGATGVCTYCANLYVENAEVPVRNSRFENSAKDGLWVWSGVANISDSVFNNNALYPIRFQTAAADPVLERLSGSGNGIQAVAIGPGIMQGDYVWEVMGFGYDILGTQTVGELSTLSISAGLQIRFAASARLLVNGTLKAGGSAIAPILFTGMSEVPGFWQGVGVVGRNGRKASATFDYATIAFAGANTCTYCANLYIEYGSVNMTHSVIRDGAKDGVWAWNAGVVSIETTEIVGNAGHGVNNEPYAGGAAILAANNWWGSPTGPTMSNGCNPGGTGSSIRGSVAVAPFQTVRGEDPGPVPVTSMMNLSLAPTRWFAPADNLSRVFVKATLRSGDGQPLPGRTILLHSTLGTVTDGGVTDVKGETFAFVRSANPGEAELTAEVDTDVVCEFARSPVAKLTFRSADESGLTPDMEAPYMNSGMEIIPEPITRGVLTKLRAKLTNKNNFPIIVDATFAFAQTGLGLTFGPVGEVFGRTIPANSHTIIEVNWTPTISGHYCVQLEYSSRTVASDGRIRAMNGGSGRSQRNLNVFGGGLGDKNEKDSLNKADKAFNLVKKAPGLKHLAIQKSLIGAWWDAVKDAAEKISENLGGDPPRLDYTLIALPRPKPAMAPVQPSAQVSAARAAALNAYNDALLDVMVIGEAAVISLDRQGGAAAAQDLAWSSQQAAALIQHKTDMGTALLNAADKLDAFIQVLRNEGETDTAVTVADAIAYQNRLATSGFTSEEIANATLLGRSAEDMEAYKQDVIATDPAKMAGDIFDFLVEESDSMRRLGNAILFPPNFPISISGGSGKTTGMAGETTNKLARVFSHTLPIQIGNPLATTATIDLRIRDLGLPPDWAATVNPDSITLDSGQQVTVQVTITAGAPVPQGTQPRIAVEGYVGTELIGGVTMDVMVPNFARFKLGPEGDSNGDDAINVADVFYLTNTLFTEGPAPVTPSDLNNDGGVNVGDLFYLINHLFAGGPAPQ